jgi:Ca2+/H+ antiporter, TMEM165/GDT1 family
MLLPAPAGSKQPRQPGPAGSLGSVGRLGRAGAAPSGPTADRSSIGAPPDAAQSAAVHPFLISAAVVAIAEIGDKTQLLALVLAARFRKPGLILLGILCATVVNHLMAGALGAWIASEVRPSILRVIVAATFLVMAVWTLIPDRYEEEQPMRPRFGVFGTTVIAFFLAEMGDKTQVATATLAARYHTLVPVVAGSVLGMLAMDALAILIGGVAAKRLPLNIIRAVAAGLFLLLAGLALASAGS